MSSRFETVLAEAQAGLKSMIRKRDPAGIAGLRSVIAALENACAVAVDDPASLVVADQHIAGAGRFGQVEASRRQLSAAEVDQILADEIAQRREQAETFDQTGRDLEAAMATYQAKLIERLRDGRLSGLQS